MKFLFCIVKIMNSYEISEMMAWNFRLEDKGIEGSTRSTKDKVVDGEI